MKNSTSNKITNKLTFFFILGLLSILAIIIFSIIALNSVSAQDGLAGMYALFGLIPVIIIMILDRILSGNLEPARSIKFSSILQESYFHFLFLIG